MNSLELIDYLKDVGEYIEYSFYTNSSEIMTAISESGFERVFNVISIEEVRKGVYNCVTTWDTDNGSSFKKNVVIDMSGEMVFITETLDNQQQDAVPSVDIDMEREYGEVLKLLKRKQLNSIEKAIFIKVVKAFFE